MRVYHVHPLAGLVLLILLCAALFSLLVMLPVAGIQWLWNVAVSSLYCLPIINMWQAGLLYLALFTTLFLLGFFRFKISFKSIE